jgi:hypothetical protein
MSIEFDDLSAELWLNVFSLLGADATILHWTAVSHVCRYWRTVSGDWFEQWLRTQSLGTKFCYFGRTKHELVFLRRQIAGEFRTHTRQWMQLTEFSNETTRSQSDPLHGTHGFSLMVSYTVGLVNALVLFREALWLRYGNSFLRRAAEAVHVSVRF